MTQKLVWVLKGTIYYLLTMVSISLVLYIRAYVILGRAPQNESEEARSFGFERFIDVFQYFFFASIIILPISIILLLFLLFGYKYRTKVLFSILIFITYCISICIFFLGIPNIGVWILG